MFHCGARRDRPFPLVPLMLFKGWRVGLSPFSNPKTPAETIRHPGPRSRPPGGPSFPGPDAVSRTARRKDGGLSPSFILPFPGWRSGLSDFTTHGAPVGWLLDGASRTGSFRPPFAPFASGGRASGGRRAGAQRGQLLMPPPSCLKASRCVFMLEGIGNGARANGVRRGARRPGIWTPEHSPSPETFARGGRRASWPPPFPRPSPQPACRRPRPWTSVISRLPFSRRGYNCGRPGRRAPRP